MTNLNREICLVNESFQCGCISKRARDGFHRQHLVTVALLYFVHLAEISVADIFDNFILSLIRTEYFGAWHYDHTKVCAADSSLASE